MESNWRWNVWDYGMSESGFRLIARCLPGPFGGLLIGTKDVANQHYRALVPAPGQLPVWFGPDNWPPPFPYYYPVEPD